MNNIITNLNNIKMMNHTKGRIGIITGAGPDAGIDLWQKILLHNKLILGSDFKGDISAPFVIIYSLPELGLVMEIDKNEELIWNVLKKSLVSLRNQIDYLCIACNILHYYEPQINDLKLGFKFVSIADTTLEYLRKNEVKEVALLSIPKVASLGKYSPYKNITQFVDVEQANHEEMNVLVKKIKLRGPLDKEVENDFDGILAQLYSENVLLACTELPLLKSKNVTQKLIDPTDILAMRIARYAIEHHSE